MKTGIKALPLSLALSFLALLGACSSVNSTPNSELPGGDNSVILEDVENGIDTVEDLTSEGTSEDTELESAEIETTDGMEEETAVDEDVLDTESAEIETTDGMEEETAVDEDVLDTESAEIETTDGMEEETAVDEDVLDTESAEIETTDGIEEESAIDTEMTDTETAEETDPTEIILPEDDSAEVETDSEAADNIVPELDIDIQAE